LSGFKIMRMLPVCTTLLPTLHGAWTPALQAVPELHIFVRLTRRLCGFALFVRRGVQP
jgi:hypothetical protein